MVKFIEELRLRTRKIDFTRGNFVTCYSEYKNISEKLLDEVAPVKIRTITTSNKPKWIDEEYRKSRRERRKLEKLWKKNRSEINQERYVEQRRKCAELSVTKQKIFYSNIIDSSSGNQNSLVWHGCSCPPFRKNCGAGRDPQRKARFLQFPCDVCCLSMHTWRMLPNHGSYNKFSLFKCYIWFVRVKS